MAPGVNEGAHSRERDSGELQTGLLIGLGLANALSLDEFKSVIAHEFGHLVAISLKLPRHMAEEKRPDQGKTPKVVQNEADKAAQNLLGISIRYNRRTLQEVKL